MGECTQLLDPMLQLLASGGEGGGDGGTGAAEAQTGPDSGRPGKAGGEVTVLYGKQPEQQPSDHQDSDAGSTDEKQEKRQTQRERKLQFRQMVDGEFKDLYLAEMQRVIDRRFKDHKELQERLESQQTILDSLLSRYHIPDGDLGKLQEALDGDHAYWETAADEAGMTVEQYRQMQKLQQENLRLRSVQMNQQAQEQSRQQVQQWLQEAEALKEDYPEFDLGQFIQSPQNLEYLKHHVPLRMVYEYANREQIQAEVAAKAAQQTERSVVEGIRSKGARPRENGATAQPGTVIKSNVDELTYDDIDDIIRRVQRGERISF